MSQDGKLEVWTRPLADGQVAAGLSNRGQERASVTGSFTIEVEPHGGAALLLDGRV